jgi:hypothetical protein
LALHLAKTVFTSDKCETVPWSCCCWVGFAELLLLGWIGRDWPLSNSLTTKSNARRMGLKVLPTDNPYDAPIGSIVVVRSVQAGRPQHAPAPAAALAAHALTHAHAHAHALLLFDPI